MNPVENKQPSEWALNISKNVVDEVRAEQFEPPMKADDFDCWLGYKSVVNKFAKELDSLKAENEEAKRFADMHTISGQPIHNCRLVLEAQSEKMVALKSQADGLVKIMEIISMDEWKCYCAREEGLMCQMHLAKQALEAYRKGEGK